MTTPTSETKTKVSVSIIGDAFADIFCYLENGLPPLGGDIRVGKPMSPVPGGSGINTATHLSSLVRQFSPYDESEEFVDIMVQTVVNENDQYGQLLIEHSKEHNFELVNCRKVKKNNESETKTEESLPSTGHCVVFVAEGERSFATHLGVIETFKASNTILHELVNCRSANPNFKNHHHHIHIAGFFNLPGFANGNLKRRLQKVREKRRSNSHGLNAYTTTISLVPQYDATEKWDGGLLDVLPLVDFLILNSLEAERISGIPVDESVSDLDRVVSLTKLADFFWEKSPQTYIILTLGSKGAVAMYEGEVIISRKAPKQYKNPVDPTGAGDAFAAGFLFGTMKWRQERNHESCGEIGSYLSGSWNAAIEEGMDFGCAAGTACVMQEGASVPASMVAIEKLMNASSDDEEENESEHESKASSKELESEDDSYDSEYDSDYDSSYDSDDYSDENGEEKKEIYEL